MIEDFVYVVGSKPVEFGNWIKPTRVRLGSERSQLGSWFDVVYYNAKVAYDSYLALSPLQRSAGEREESALATHSCMWPWRVWEVVPHRTG